MALRTTLYGKTYQFSSVRDVLARAGEEKSGDALMGIGAESQMERVAARQVLAHLTLEDLYENPVAGEEDEVTRLTLENLNTTIYSCIKSWTVAGLREYLLSHAASGEDVMRLAPGLTGEMAAAAAKLMSNMDLVYGAQKIRVVTRARTAIGQAGTLAFRIQPNHPTDDPQGILASIMEGLSYGSGDAVIGINPVNETAANTVRLLEMSADFIQQWQIPTQNCVLSHVTVQMEALRQGAPLDVMFQSIAGTEGANQAFGIDAALLDEAFDLVKKRGSAPGPNLMYFETGQGSEMSIGEDGGADMATLEARTYALGRLYQPFMVNNVSGFIGPETHFDGKQILRANLEDHFMGKLLGLPMGMAPCYTNHARSDQNDQETATMLLTLAGANYFMGVPGNDDVMLSYQDTSYHDDATLRELLGLRPAPEFERWLEKMGLWEQGRLTPRAGDLSLFLAGTGKAVAE